MAERRMFAKTIIDSDVFLDMPLSTQALYFHLSMRADDDGFINNPKKIMRMVGASQNELEILLAKRYLLSFDSGVVVVKHWKIHNYIQKDRYKPTLYKEEMQIITVKENKSYTDNMDTECIQDGDTGKVRLGKDSKGKSKNSGGFSFDFIEDEEWREVYREWCDNKPKPYKKKLGVEKGYTQLLNLSNNDIETARKIIDRSLANGWAGLFELPGNKKPEPVQLMETI